MVAASIPTSKVLIACLLGFLIGAKDGCNGAPLTPTESKPESNNDPKSTNNTIQLVKQSSVPLLFLSFSDQLHAMPYLSKFSAVVLPSSASDCFLVRDAGQPNHWLGVFVYSQMAFYPISGSGAVVSTTPQPSWQYTSTNDTSDAIAHVDGSRLVVSYPHFQDTFSTARGLVLTFRIASALRFVAEFKGPSNMQSFGLALAGGADKVYTVAQDMAGKYKTFYSSYDAKHDTWSNFQPHPLPSMEAKPELLGIGVQGLMVQANGSVFEVDDAGHRITVLESSSSSWYRSGPSCFAAGNSNSVQLVCHNSTAWIKSRVYQLPHDTIANVVLTNDTIYLSTQYCIQHYAILTALSDTMSINWNICSVAQLSTRSIRSRAGSTNESTATSSSASISASVTVSGTTSATLETASTVIPTQQGSSSSANVSSIASSSSSASKASSTLDVRADDTTSTHAVPVLAAQPGMPVLSLASIVVSAIAVTLVVMFLLQRRRRQLNQLSTYEELEAHHEDKRQESTVVTTTPLPTLLYSAAEVGDEVPPLQPLDRTLTECAASYMHAGAFQHSGAWSKAREQIIAGEFPKELPADYIPLADCIDACGRTLLTYACMAGNLEAATTLCSAMKPRLVNVTDQEGRTPAHWAACVNFPAALTMLWKKNPQCLFSTTTQGGNVMHLAVLENNHEIIQTLLDLRGGFLLLALVPDATGQVACKMMGDEPNQAQALLAQSLNDMRLPKEADKDLRRRLTRAEGMRRIRDRGHRSGHSSSPMETYGSSPAMEVSSGESVEDGL
eukprot:m.175391 g.175391  ORF g.175391 m.175391 type:complete len:784 (-) comp16778_c0_seq2:142-2493(-)